MPPLVSWALIKATGDPALIAAHGALHWSCKDWADKTGITPGAGGVHTDAGGGDKPPKPS